MIKFEIGKTYCMNSICDSNCIWKYTVIARTACTVKITDGKTVKSCRINKYVSEIDGAEAIYPDGRYSMCPILRASRIA